MDNMIMDLAMYRIEKSKNDSITEMVSKGDLNLNELNNLSYKEVISQLSIK